MIAPFTIQLAIVNFSVAAILAYRANKQNTALAQIKRKVSFFIFIAATISGTWALAASVYHTPWPQLQSLILANTLAWTAILAYFLLKIAHIALIAAPAAVICLLLHNPISHPSSILNLHIAGAIMGQILAIQAAIVAITYLWQNYLLKHKHLDRLTPYLPAQDLLYMVLRTCLSTGLIFLTAALCGGLFYYFIYDHQPLPTAKLAWAILIWLWYLCTYFIPKKPRHLALVSLLGILAFCFQQGA